MKRLKDLLSRDEVLEEYMVNWDEEITGISDHSQSVKEGYIFVARRGTKLNGKEFIPEAIKRGAKLIIQEDSIDLDLYAPQIRLKDFKETLGKLLSRFYDYPQNSITLVGITGTNGKTSSTFFIKALSSALGVKSGYIGSIYYDVGEVLPSRETTPSSFELFPFLKKAKDLGIKLLALEVSSHALDQDRIFGLNFSACGFTNLSRDHLDYHGDMESYFQAKKKLFTKYLKEDGAAVISFETEYGRRLFKELKASRPALRLIFVNDDFFRVALIRRTPFLELTMEIAGKTYNVKTRLVGDFQAKNLGVALGVLYALGFPVDDLVKALPNLTNPPGRLELVGEKNGAYVFVDYAHTPDALRSALESLAPLQRNRLIVLFGCGGNRDAGKRPLMGKVAEELSDLIILTSDNPRFEDPKMIIEDIKKGLTGMKPCYVWVDREEAIKSALEMLRAGDVLLIAGKGHEDYQEVQGKRIPFSDREVVKRLLSEIKS